MLSGRLVDKVLLDGYLLEYGDDLVVVAVDDGCRVDAVDCLREDVGGDCCDLLGSVPAFLVQAGSSLNFGFSIELLLGASKFNTDDLGGALGA